MRNAINSLLSRFKTAREQVNGRSVEITQTEADGESVGKRHKTRQNRISKSCEAMSRDLTYTCLDFQEVKRKNRTEEICEDTRAKNCTKLIINIKPYI